MEVADLYVNTQQTDFVDLGNCHLHFNGLKNESPDISASRVKYRLFEVNLVIKDECIMNY